MADIATFQHPQFFTAVLTPSKISPSGAVADYAVKALGKIPSDALLTGRGWIDVQEAFDPGTSLTLDLGDGTDDDEYTFDGAVDLTAVAITALTRASGAFAASLVGVAATVSATLTLVGAVPSSGKVVIYMEYLRPETSVGVN